VRSKSSDSGNNQETVEALKRALVGIKILRYEASIMVSAVPEKYLPELISYLQILTGLKQRKKEVGAMELGSIPCRICRAEKK
jgi:hypothetical protein